MTERDLNQTRLDSQLIYQGRRIRLTLDTIAIPGKGRAERAVVWHPGAVVLLPVTPAGEVLLVRQHRYAAGETLVELPAGTVEEGEEPAATAARELQEEVGMAAGCLTKLAEFYSAPGFCSERMHLYLAEDLVPARLAADDDEDIEVVRLSLLEAMNRMAAGGIRDAKTMVGLLLYARLMGGIGGTGLR